MCYAVGDLMNQDAAGASQHSGALVTINDGVVSSPQSVPGTDELIGIACANADICYLLGFSTSGGIGIIVPMTDGALGMAQVTAGVGLVQALACPPEGTTCYAVGESSSGGNGVVVPITDGEIGAAEAIPGPAYPIDIACPTDGTCYVVGGTGPRVNPPGTIVPLTNGVVGMPQPVASVFEFRHIACVGSDTCYISANMTSGPDVIVTMSSGSVTSTQSVSTTNILAVRCVDSGTCYALGEHFPAFRPGIDTPPSSEPDVLTLTNSSGTWELQTLPVDLPVGSLDGIACPSSQICYAIGGGTPQAGVSPELVLPITGGIVGTPQLVPGSAG